MKSAEDVVRGADVVVTVTASPTPVIQNEWVSEGIQVIAVGSCRPTQRELDPALVARSRLVVDSRAAALQEAGDVIMGIADGLWTADHITAEFGDLPVRNNDREITVFKSLGLAVEDLCRPSPRRKHRKGGGRSRRCNECGGTNPCPVDLFSEPNLLGREGAVAAYRA